MSDATAVPAPARPAAARWRDRSMLLVTCVGLFVTQLDLTVVNIGVSAVQADLGTGTSTATWVVAAYFVSYAACMLGLGELGDVLGRGRVFLAGLLGFTLASAACALAPGAAVLIAARAVQGVFGAAVLVSSLSLLVHHFDGPGRARVIGLWSAVAGLALVAGPTLGGVLVDGLGWRWMFWINLPICLAGMALGARVVPLGRPPAAGRPVDWRGQALALGALTGVALGVESLAAARGASPAGWAALALGLLLAAAFLASQRTAPAPLVPLALFRSRPFGGANAAALLLNFGTLGLLFLLSLYFVRVAGMEEGMAGLCVAPLFAGYIAVSTFAGRAAARWGSRLPAAAGLAVAGVAGAAVALAAADRHTAPVVAAATLCGTGIGLTLPALIAVSVGAVGTERAGLASGLNNTARQIGGSLGVATLGGIVAASDSTHTGIVRALAVNAAVYLLGAWISFTTLPGRSAEEPRC
ncbi:MFS transporter [Streptomyces sp. DSM 44917]|uniref:MFS transporter n=1 Tax=Streptomyces boetiae TaxID=3075541 RepID=A0ABU2LFB6_9ACTN|nr:MFS transporter [Streptomyces sp. DSM 44917]MDT0310140.1 MFS transporter [Streptomyces sp. DSM 44917]